MTAIFLALATSLGYGAGDFLAGRVSQHFAPVLIVLYVQATQSIAVLTLALATHQPFALPALLWGINAGLLNAIGLMLYYQALKIGSSGVVAPIVASGAVVPVVVSIARGKIPSLLTLIGLLTVLTGIVVSTVASGYRNEMSDCPSPPCRGATRSLRRFLHVVRRPKMSVVFAVLAAIAFGGFFILINQGSAVANAGILWVVFGVQVGALPATLISAVVQRINLTQRPRPAIILYLGLVVVLNLGADAALPYALKLGNLSIVSVLASLGPVVTGLLARLIIAERLSQSQMLGVSFVLLGTLTVAYGR